MTWPDAFAFADFVAATWLDDEKQPRDALINALVGAIDRFVEHAGIKHDGYGAAMGEVLAAAAAFVRFIKPETSP